MSTNTITDQDIHELRTQAALAGDTNTVKVCTDALTGDAPARLLCGFLLGLLAAGRKELAGDEPDENEDWGLAEDHEAECQARAEADRLEHLRDLAEQHAVDRYLDDCRGANSQPPLAYDRDDSDPDW